MRAITAAVLTALLAAGCVSSRASSDLMYSASVGDVAGVRDALSRGANPNVHELKSSALQEAAARGHLEIVRMLLDAGANPNAIHTSFWFGTGRPALIRALPHPEIVKLLLERGANPNRDDGDGSTPLHYAASGSTAAIVELLLARGAAIDALDYNKNTPLSRAAWRADPEGAAVVELLIARGANIEPRDRQNQSALDYAMKAGNARSIAALQNAASRQR